MNGGEKLSSIVDKIRENANAETVYGEPIEREGKTVVPVAKIAYGFGGGYGSEARDESQNGGEGGGIGGGVKATPAGVVEITDYETRFIKFSDMKKFAVIAGLFLVFGYLLGRK
ncbi:MAG: spore germination protein GerW family protein [Halobacteriales archaeon]|nr:spore germination protein GerW family protein [Halobacteriales archaeon]